MRHVPKAMLLCLVVAASACAGPTTTQDTERGAGPAFAASACAGPTTTQDTERGAGPSSAAPSASSDRAAIVGSGAPTTRATSTAALVPTASASAAPTAAVEVSLDEMPKLLGEGGEPLPQTEDRPVITSAAFEKRMKLLVQAIAADDPSIAAPVFFPKVAYEAVKDIKNPGADWKSRLMKAFSRDIHAYHEKLGDDAASATYLGLGVDDKRVKWMAKGKEGNKIGYFRVTRNKLKIGLAGAKERELELTSLISWRGEWFVVHLSGFK